jgi:hypothetical protein
LRVSITLCTREGREWCEKTKRTENGGKARKTLRQTGWERAVVLSVRPAADTRPLALLDLDLGLGHAHTGAHTDRQTGKQTNDRNTPDDSAEVLSVRAAADARPLALLDLDLGLGHAHDAWHLFDGHSLQPRVDALQPVDRLEGEREETWTEREAERGGRERERGGRERQAAVRC